MKISFSRFYLEKETVESFAEGRKEDKFFHESIPNFVHFSS
jgi:hypothetical protein